MTTIFNLQLDSDDSDSEYNLSDDEETESEDENEIKRRKREERQKKEKEKLEKQADDMYKDMLKESDLCYKHNETILKNDFMLQFHKRIPIRNKINTTLPELIKYMNNSISRIFNDNLTIDIKKFKQDCYSTSNDEKLQLVKNAVITLDDDLHVPTLKNKFIFAGTIYEIHEQVDKKSKKYLNTLKKQKKSLGGNFKFLDDMLSELNTTRKLSAISKSEIDWNQFKDKNNLSESLRRQHKYIKDQEFLNRVSWKEYETKRNAKNNDT